MTEEEVRALVARIIDERLADEAIAQQSKI